MDAVTRKSCPNCSQLYKLQSISNELKGNIPLLLSCGHTMCENCLKNIVKFLEPIECKICHHDMEVSATDVTLLSQNKITLYQLFPVNVYMLGELVLQTSEVIPHKRDKAADFRQDILLNSIQANTVDTNTKNDYYIDLNAIIKSTDNSAGQCLECHNTTSKMCQQCATVLCEVCFNKTHKTFIIFKNHVLKNIEPIMDPNTCKIHKDKALDYYCKDCEKPVCLDCMMVGGEKSCKLHDIVSIQEVNESLREDIIDLMPKVNETYKRLTKTAVDIGTILHNIENDTGTSSELTQILATVEQHFSKLFFTVQKHKEEVVGIITKLKCSEKDSLHKARTDVANTIKSAIQAINKINLTTDPKYSDQINLSSLLDEAKIIADSPWYLSRDESDKDPLKIAVNEDLCTLISDYIHLEGNAKSVYKLRSTAELGEGVEIPPAPPAPVFPPELPKDVRQQKKPKEAEKKSNKGPMLYKEVPKYRSKSDSLTSLNSHSSDSSQRDVIYRYEYNQSPAVHPVSPFPESHHPKQLHEGSQELIYITHIVNPHNFFVQRACHQSLVKEMVREFRNAHGLPKPSLSHVAEGKNYLVFNKVDNMWQRCRVISIDRKDLDNPLFQVFCMDFGSTEVVRINNLRLLPPARVQSPFPLAINCKLANCVPKNGSWTSDDSFLIQNIINNKQAVIHVRHIRSTSNYSVTLECDVTNFEDGVSLAHALVFHERARMPQPKLSYPKLMGSFEKPRIFLNNNCFPVNTNDDVYITHIVSPDKFFVRMCHLQNVYEKLCEDLEQEYALTGNNGSIYLPEVGMFCVVNLQKYRRSENDGVLWARAYVLELPGRGRVRLFLVDTGASLLVHWTALKRLHNKFTKLSALATECHLAGVTPLNKKWSPGSVALLQKYEDRVLNLHVENLKGTIGVTLFDKTDEEDVVCINKEMIKHRFAISFGLFNFNKSNVEDQVITNKSPLDEPKPRRKPNPDQIKILKKQPEPKIEEKDLDAKDKGPLRLEAKILYYQSPSLIYVSLVHQQKVFNELYENIQKYYSKKKTQGKTEWKVGDRCCTICKQSETWRRAVIVEVEGDNAKIFYSDFACVETVPIANLKELAPEFSSMGDAAIKCHLCGIMPAIGEEWPSLTKEHLKELLDAYKRVFITKRGNFNFKEKISMPVEIWVYHTIQGGALEANKSEWRCLNKKIVEQGLAIPDKSQEPANAETSTEIPNDDILSFLNLTGSVHDWLQLEPLPTKPLVSTEDEKSRNSCTSEENEDQVDQEEATTSNTMFISDWLKPEPLANKEFTGVPTYIDMDGVIYLHDVTQQDTLDLIRKALDVRFANPDPKAKYAKWTVGEPCIALFFLDSRFYRGRIMEVNNETSSCLIHYIDYGNEEWCSFENLRKSIALHQIPVQAHKCILNRIQPTGKHWDRQTLDYVHKFVVEKQCLVKITGDPIGDLIPIDLKYDKLWINDHLVDFEMAIYTDGSKAVVKKFTPRKAHKEIVIESDSGPDYIVDDDQNSSQTSIDVNSMEGKDWNKILEEEEQQCLQDTMATYPKHDFTEFTCNITTINDVNVLQLSLILDEDLSKLYENMFEELRNEAENLPPLNGIFEYKACVALFPEDNDWYRACILQYSESKGQLKVRYVDYGNIEVIPLSDAREITTEWTNLPPQCIAATLDGVKVNPEIDINVITKEYTDTFLDKGPFKGTIVDCDKHVAVVELRNDAGELVYENLIESGVFLKCDESEN